MVEGLAQVHGLVVEDNEALRRTIMTLPPRAVGDVKISWEGAATAAEALPKLSQTGLRLVLADMCLAAEDRGNRDGLVVAYFAARYTNASVFLMTGYELDADTQCELHEFGVWPFTKAVEPVRLLSQITKAAQNPTQQRLPPSHGVLAQIAALMRMVDGRITDVAKWALGIAAEEARKETGGNKKQAADLLGEERKFVDRAAEWFTQIPRGPTVVKAGAIVKSDTRTKR